MSKTNVLFLHPLSSPPPKNKRYTHINAEPVEVSGLGSTPTAFCHPLQSVPPVPHLVNLISIMAQMESELRDQKAVCFDENEFRSKLDRDKDKVMSLNKLG